MNHALEGLTGRVEVALTVMVSFVLVAVLPVMVTSTADPSGTAVAVLALAVTVLIAVGMRRFSLPTPVHAALLPAAHGVPPVLPGRVTDPLHHPLRPRAPGLA